MDKMKKRRHDCRSQFCGNRCRMETDRDSCAGGNPEPLAALIPGHARKYRKRLTANGERIIPLDESPSHPVNGYQPLLWVQFFYYRCFGSFVPVV
ncbi:MAG: hypothetical protein ACLFTT_18295, partial [Candidatus Hydrogenedentota bacterium]